MKISEKRQSSRSAANESDAGYYLKLLSEEIRTVVASTVDDDGLPTTCAIDIMDWDSDGLYFLTARGKGFHHRLTARGYIAITGIKGSDTMSSLAISVRGKVEELGKERLDRLLRKNPYMFGIYPSEESRKALSAFRLHEGSGEYFDLSVRPIARIGFSFGGNEYNHGYEFMIAESCTGCGLCLNACPQECIDSGTVPFSIIGRHCLLCGRCADICPVKAIARRGDNDDT